MKNTNNKIKQKKKHKYYLKLLFALPGTVYFIKDDKNITFIDRSLPCRTCLLQTTRRRRNIISRARNAKMQNTREYVNYQRKTG